MLMCLDFVKRDFKSTDPSLKEKHQERYSHLKDAPNVGQIGLGRTTYSNRFCLVGEQE